MSGPNREWFLGNRGPDYHAESQRRVRHGTLHDRAKVGDSTKPTREPRLRQESKPR